MQTPKRTYKGSWTVYRQPVYRHSVYRQPVYQQVQFIDKYSLLTNNLWKIDFRQNNTVIQSKENNNGFINIYKGLFINLKLIIYCLKYIVN